MNSKQLFWIFVTVMLFAIHSPKNIVQKIQSQFPTDQIAKIRFTQVFYWTTSETSDTLNGLFYLSPDNQYRIVTPIQEILFDGKNIWSHNLQNKQIIIDIQQESEFFDLEFLRGNWEEKYQITKIKSNLADQVVLKLVPKDEDSNVVFVKVIIQKESWQIVSFLQEDVNGNQTTLFVGKTDFFADDAFQFETIENDSAEVIDFR